MVFRGTFEYALDAKHRLTVPAKFRPPLAGGVVLAASHEVRSDSFRSVSIWTPDGYEQFVARSLAGLNPAQPMARELNRFFNNTSFDAELDSANRVMIPPNLRDYAGLDKEVVVIGSGECLEVFDRARYAPYSVDVETRVPDLAASLGHTS